uniref:25S rRNA (uridine-N(3))-methyltransferase BMT5-like domain-containing protein n=1 Tax=Hyaloperonospora arabidopsidis (strain Emoy2) TaxID=559515 RepID=M4BFN6_HYAAE
MARLKSSQKRRASGPSSSDSSRCLKRQRHELQPTPIQIYAPKDTVLIVGDGDFSFSRGLVKHRGTGLGIIATSFDSDSQVCAKYSNAHECIAAVQSSLGLVLHDVDATKLLELPQHVQTGTGSKTISDVFQYIIFNFPHSGQQRVHINRALLLNFFESARDRLSVHGEVHVTLKTQPPYSNWFVEDRAKEAGFVLKERRKFDSRLFPGYRHRTTDPQAKKFDLDLCVTFVFVVNRSKYPFQERQAELKAVSAGIAATEASEQRDLATAIVNIAKANVAASQNVDKDSDLVVRRAPPKQLTKRPAHIAALFEEKERRNETGYGAHATCGVLWKPLHRRSSGSIR